MRNLKIWKPRYLKNRLGTFLYEKLNPDLPWLTPMANQILEDYLRKSDVGVEFGSGRSTIWFSSKVQFLTSVEHNPEWGSMVSNMLIGKGINNVDYKVIPREKEKGKGATAKYVRVLDSIENSSLDFCLVDGVYRDHCSKLAIDKVKPGGILIIDNVNRYLPSNTFSPCSIKVDESPKTEVWISVLKSLNSWRKVWTSSGVTDTAFYFKPVN